MRFALFVIMIFLWGIWFAVASMNYEGEFMGSPEQNFIGWGGSLLLVIAAGLLLRDWFKKSNIMSWIRKKFE